MRPSPRALLGLLAVLAGAFPVAAGAADSCYFGVLEWRDDGAVLRFQAGPAAAAQTLEMQLRTGVLSCVEPQVQEAAWDPGSRRVLFRDAFGIYALDVERSELQSLAFLPAVSRTFLRAFGFDARGTLWLWTLDRDTGEHVFWRRTGAALEALPGSYDGAEALRSWEERAVSLPFQRVGGRFARSTCVQRRATGERLCLERGEAAAQRAAAFRLILGGPGRIEVILDRCAPSALAVPADTTRVVASLFEDVDAQGGSELLALWVSDFQRATRVVESLLPRALATTARHRNSIFWIRSTELFWADTVGQLFRVDSRAPAATALVSPCPRERPSLAIVVVETVPTAAAAETLRARLVASGLDAGVQARDGGYEVQSGAFESAGAAGTHLETLRRAGFPAGRIAAGNVDAVADEMSWGWVQSRTGAVAFVRQSRRGERVLAEIWRESPTGEVELLVPAFDAATPRAVP